MRDEQTNARQPITCTWVAVTAADGRTHMEARWLGAEAPAAVPAAAVAAHAA